MKINSLNKKYGYLIHTCSYKAFKGTVVNRVLPSLHEGSLEIMFTVPLSSPVAEFKEFERRFKFKPQFKYGWFHLKLY